MDGILLACFGTTAREKLQGTYGALAEELRQRWPECQVRTAFTSPTVRRKLSAAGVETVDVPTALQQMAAEGMTRVGVLAAFIMLGIEYHRLLEDCRGAAGDFAQLTVSAPLLDSPEDLAAVGEAVLAQHPDLSDDTVLALVGHGTGHRGDFAYGALDCAFRELGRENVFVATVEGTFGLTSLRRRVERYAPRRVILRPLLLVAGEHVKNDIAGEEPDSWRNRLAADGRQVECVIQGLGELPSIRDIFLAHFRRDCDRERSEQR